jgi:hypothetical protein
MDTWKKVALGAVGVATVGGALVCGSGSLVGGYSIYNNQNSRVQSIRYGDFNFEEINIVYQVNRDPNGTESISWCLGEGGLNCVDTETFRASVLQDLDQRILEIKKFETCRSGLANPLEDFNICLETK